jgi:hypothetical protein
VLRTSPFDYAHWLGALDDESLDEIADAAETVLMIHDALANDTISLLGELLRDEESGPITAWQHYPVDDCVDPRTGAMFYYHAHDPGDWNRGEHGHFHLFVRPSAEAEFSHVMAISMTAQGVPNGLFATNGWVTDESMLPAPEVLRLLEDRWEISRARPSWLVVQWLTALLKLLRPHAAELLERRDRRLGWSESRSPNVEILEDRETHILSEMALDLPTVLQAIQVEVGRRMNA